jgi:hypothetical protein
MRGAIRDRVMRFVDDLLSGPAGTDVRAVAVSGSAAREEERWVGGELASDIDVMVISNSSRFRIDRTREVQRVLARHATANLEGGRVPVSTLSYATLANFEARHRGVVVHGDQSALGLIPMPDPAQIPAWEAMRLLANRLFEHLKLRAGMIAPEDAAIKSYEAIAESQLVLEGRYRPSFAERVAEIERAPLRSPVACADSNYLAAEEIRSGRRSMIGVTPTRALEDLQEQLLSTMRSLGLPDDTISAGFEGLARREFHLAQRVFWSSRGLGKPGGRHRPTTDPIIQVWGAGLNGLREGVNESEARSLVQLWQGCPQILRKGVGK